MELKDRIIQEASTLFFNKGVRSMTMSDIANELGISKRTLYEVFRDKDELLEICVDMHMEKADKEMEMLANSSEDVIDTLMRIYSKHLHETQDVHKSVLHDLKKYHAHIYKKIECRQKDGLATFTPLLKRGIEEGLIRDNLNIEILLWLLKAQFKALMNDEYIPTNKYAPEEFIRSIILNFTRGIATPLGNEKIDTLIENFKNQINER
jgi:AcrR family transcriptional regulator